MLSGEKAAARSVRNSANHSDLARLGVSFDLTLNQRATDRRIHNRGGCHPDKRVRIRLAKVLAMRLVQHARLRVGR